MSNELILVFNCGSSSLKFAVLNPYTGTKHLWGLVECLHLPEAHIKWNDNRIEHNFPLPSCSSHIEAFKFIMTKIFLKQKVIFSKIKGIGHRVVHGGKKIKESSIINSKIIRYIKEASCFAPLHNPINLMGIKEAMRIFSNLSKKNVAVFDTSFYQNIPKKACLYAIPYKFYVKYGIKRYGAHGTSHNYVVLEASKILNKSVSLLNVISCHLGNGASVSVIKNGICVDTSMGLTPLEGLVMGTRSGDIDPSVIFFMFEELKFSINKIKHILIKESGLLGLNGITSDFRYIEKKYRFDKKFKFSIDMFCYRVARYIASYIASIGNRLDAIIFTGGIGENSSLARELSLSNLSLLGLAIDSKKNLLIRFGKSGFINSKCSIPILVIPTNEELAIAKETISLLNRS